MHLVQMLSKQVPHSPRFPLLWHQQGCMVTSWGCELLGQRSCTCLQSAWHPCPLVWNLSVTFHKRPHCPGFRKCPGEPAYGGAPGGAGRRLCGRRGGVLGPGAPRAPAPCCFCTMPLRGRALRRGCLPALGRPLPLPAEGGGCAERAGAGRAAGTTTRRGSGRSPMNPRGAFSADGRPLSAT